MKTFTSENPPLSGTNENFVGCSISTCHSICFSSSQSLIMANASVGVKICLQRSFKVFSSLFPIVVAHFNTSKISCSMFFPCPKLSLLFQNVGGGLDANGSMYITLVALKTSFLTLCNSLSSTSFFSFSLFNYASFLLAFSLN